MMLPTLLAGHQKLVRPEPRWELDRWFEDVLGRQFTSVPEADLFETENELVLELDIPGFDEDHVDVMVEQGVLTITGERKAEDEVDRGNFHVRERSWGKFTRTFPVPTTIDATEVTAAYEKGVLTVTMPKTAEALARKIKVDVK